MKSEFCRCWSGLLVFAALIAWALPASAKPRIEISIAQAREIVELKDGVKTARLVETQSASPGDVVQYTLTYSNKGDEAATNAVIDDAIPKGTLFIGNSAAGEGAEITFSNDGGKTFAPAVKLTYEIKLPSGEVEKRTATPDEYTHVRWTLKAVPAGATGKVSFRVKVL
jgi:uncharacterized repeat protein (TIGR01451 family)